MFERFGRPLYTGTDRRTSRILPGAGIVTEKPSPAFATCVGCRKETQQQVVQQEKAAHTKESPRPYELASNWSFSN